MGRETGQPQRLNLASAQTKRLSEREEVAVHTVEIADELLQATIQHAQETAGLTPMRRVLAEVFRNRSQTPERWISDFSIGVRRSAGEHGLGRQ